MKTLIQAYHLVNKLSIDVALGAVVCSAFFAKLYLVTVEPIVFVCLGMVVWLIYTVDHLIDAKRIEKPAVSDRHSLHQRYFKLVLMITIVCIGALITMLFQLSREIIESGFLLSIFVVIYFFVHRWLSIAKEVMGALLYSTGVLLPVVSMSANPSNILLDLPVFLFFTVVLINMLLFSWFDKESDRVDGQPSIVSAVGEQNVRWGLHGLFILNFMIALGAIVFGMQPVVAFIFLSMSLVLFTLFRYATWSYQDSRFRFIGDAVFFIPLIYLY